MEKSNKTTEGAKSPLLVEGMSALDVLLARLGLTQRKFCDEMEIHRSTYDRWRRKGLITDLDHVRAKKLDAMMRNVGLSIQDLPDDVNVYSPDKSA
jgi:hypothetical protein